MVTRFVCYLSPVIIGIIIPFLLNHPVKDPPEPRQTDTVGLGSRRAGKTLSRKIIPSGITLLLILVIILCVSVFTGGLTPLSFIALASFLLVYTLMIMVVYFMLTSIGFSGIISQVIVIILILLMSGTVFYANPLIETAPSPLRGMIVQWSINLNPMLIISANFFNYDMILAPQMYKLSLIQYYPHYYLAWGYVVIGYLIVTMVCFCIIMVKRSFIKYKQ